MVKSGAQKNTKNKAKHLKLMARKKNKLRQEKKIERLNLKSLLLK